MSDPSTPDGDLIGGDPMSVDREFSDSDAIHQDPPEVDISEQISSQPVLPTPLASFVSLATTTTSLGLRLGGYVGLTALNVARVSTLVGFDISRALIDSISSREDQYRSGARSDTDVVAEGFLDKALYVLGQSIGSTSSLVSAGFDIGATSLSTGIATAQFLLSALHAILGDSQTSRAVAAIVVLFRREINDPEQNIHGESASLADIIIACLAFILLQRWGEEKTRREWRDEGVEESLCDVFVDAQDVRAEKAEAASALNESASRSRFDEQPLWPSEGSVAMPGEYVLHTTTCDDSPILLDDNETTYSDNTLDGGQAMKTPPEFETEPPYWQTPVRRALSKTKPVEKLVNFWDADRSRILADVELHSLPARPESEAEPDLTDQQLADCSSARAEAALPLIHSLHRFSKFAIASYGRKFLSLTNVWQDDLASFPHLDDTPEHQFFSTYINLPSSTVLLSSYVDSHGSRATADDDNGLPLVHYISIDHQTRAVVLTIRGTLGFDDLLTDSVCDYDEINWQGDMYRVHKGILASAKRLITLHDSRVLTTIRGALDDYPGYGLVLCGHSLGGGVAALLALLLAEPATADCPTGSEYITTAARSFGNTGVALPTQRPIHAYTYGCAACVAPTLQRATMGLITTVVHGQDYIPYLSLGTLRDFQGMALSFKHDSHNAKTEVLRRVKERFISALTKHSRLGALQDMFAGMWPGGGRSADSEPEIGPSASGADRTCDNSNEDLWPWIALKSLRAHQLSDKLVPPGEVFLVESRTVTSEGEPFQASGTTETSSLWGPESPSQLSDTASTFEEGVRASGPKMTTPKAEKSVSILLTHVHDVERRFGELRFGPSMFSDHFPGRYERVLKLLEENAGAGSGL